MVWPPPILPINRTNASPQQDTHPQDHNLVNQAVNDIVESTTAYADVFTSTPATVIPPAQWTSLTGGNLARPIAGTGIRWDATSLLIDTPGLYLITCDIVWSMATDASGRRIIGMTDTNQGAPTVDQQSVSPASGIPSTVTFNQTAAFMLYYATTGRAQLRAYQDSGASLTIAYRHVTVSRLAKA